MIYNKSQPMAPLSCTIEAHERIGAQGEVIEALDEARLRDKLGDLKKRSIEALTVSLINSFANATHEQRVREIAAEVLPDVPVSLSSEVVPEMQEYERTVTTVANSYVRPRVAKYLANLKTKIERSAQKVSLHILRSDGGLAGAQAAEEYPVNLLMSGPAGGVTGALWVAAQAGFPNLLTVDVGGTSTDVALIQDGAPQGSPRDHGGRRDRARLFGRYPNRRRRRRLDRPCAGAHQGAARRTPIRRCRSGTRRLRQGRHGAHRNRCQCRARLLAVDAEAWPAR